MANKTVKIETPVFYKEKAGSPVLQILSYNSLLAVWNVWDVSCGCATKPLASINRDNLTFNLSRFTRVQPNDATTLVRFAQESVEVLNYMNSLGIDVFNDVLKFAQPELNEPYTNEEVTPMAYSIEDSRPVSYTTKTIKENVISGRIMA